jgi:hypothetical protein
MDALDVVCADYIAGNLTAEVQRLFVERLGTDAG